MFYYTKASLITSSPPLNSDLVSVGWAGPDSVILATEDGCLSVLDVEVKSQVSPAFKDSGTAL